MIRSGPAVACVLRSGGEYKPQHVVDLYRAVREFWPRDWLFDFKVLTDFPLEDFGGISAVRIPLEHNWPGWWSKMELFRPDLDWLGDLLYFDLDTTIIGDLSDIVAVRELTFLSDFYRLDYIASGMMMLPVSWRPEMWKAWNMGAQLRRFRGDQEFMRTVWGRSDDVRRWQRLLPGQVVSYKVHVRKAHRPPENARVICFHGRPRPWQVAHEELY